MTASFHPFKSSTLVPWSLALGIIAVVCLGPIAGIPAVVCGHLALSRIKKSVGPVRGRGKAIAGLVLGYTGSVLWCLISADALAMEREQTRKVEAKVAVAAASSAVKMYHTEYGRYPLAASTLGDVTVASDNNRLFDILRALPGTEAENTRRIVFFEYRVAGSTSPKSGFGPNGVLYDPWGRPYWIRIDTNYDERVANPYDKKGASNPIRYGVIAWSLGKDGELGAHGDLDGNADILSWR